MTNLVENKRTTYARINRVKRLARQTKRVAWKSLSRFIA